MLYRTGLDDKVDSILIECSPACSSLCARTDRIGLPVPQQCCRATAHAQSAHAIRTRHMVKRSRLLARYGMGSCILSHTRHTNVRHASVRATLPPRVRHSADRVTSLHCAAAIDEPNRIQALR